METLKMVFFLNIDSQISFRVVLYSSTNDKNLYIILLQKKAIRIMLKLRLQDLVKQKCFSLGIW